MPNIAITTYCNLHCPYCFADTMINTEDIKNISLEQFEFICNWILKDKNNNEPRNIGLIGGEPTLHPQFKDILILINKILNRQKNCTSILFTNGVYLEQYIPFIPEIMSILININTPNAMSQEQWKKLNQTLDKIYILGWFTDKKAHLGCNICMEIDDYSFIWNIVDKYNIKHIRVSVTAPTKEEYKNNKDLYYRTMIPKFLSFVKEAEKRSVILGKDCNQIPECYYDNLIDLKLVQKILKNDEKHSIHCGPVIDITPDFKASACFGAYETVDCNLFNNLNELQYFLLNQFVMPKFKNNCTGQCKECKKHELFMCQGGCLAFSQLTD